MTFIGYEKQIQIEIDFMNHLRIRESFIPKFLILLCLCNLKVQGAEPDRNTLLKQQIDQAWEVTWTRFYRPQTHLFYDYLSSYEPGKELGHLPTAAEVQRQFPNPCGYSTGMEDGMILGGAMLSTIVDMYEVTGKESLKTDIDNVFQGIKLCATVHGVPGFIARAVCVEDGKSVYINSSRDQYTHCVHGLWRYYHSPLCDDETKQEIRTILSAVADRMIANVTAETNYDFLRADGKRCPLGICRMWNVRPHEAARLPMIYAATWDVTGEEKYRKQYRHYLTPAIRQTQSMQPDEHHSAYVYVQMQCSFELLHQLEQDPELKADLQGLMERTGNKALSKISHARKALYDLDLTVPGPNWRAAEKWITQGEYRNPQWGDYRRVWHAIREAGELSLVPLMVTDLSITDAQKQDLEKIILRMDYEQTSSCGIIYHLAAYWKARKRGLF